MTTWMVTGAARFVGVPVDRHQARGPDEPLLLVDGLEPEARDLASPFPTEAR
jgi:hypothetical protein